MAPGHRWIFQNQVRRTSSTYDEGPVEGRSHPLIAGDDVKGGWHQILWLRPLLRHVTFSTGICIYSARGDP
ncbi:hypothetical protein FRAHR75_180020 [Frankia sp. Hr75.2]|nr:hypothetical protein FRAHR75_180020 [Frankia sp. Hr75.2]